MGQIRASSADRIMKEAQEREHAIDALVGSPPVAPHAPMVSCFGQLQAQCCTPGYSEAEP